MKSALETDVSRCKNEELQLRSRIAQLTSELDRSSEELQEKREFSSLVSPTNLIEPRPEIIVCVPIFQLEDERRAAQQVKSACEKEKQSFKDQINRLEREKADLTMALQSKPSDLTWPGLAILQSL